MLEAARHVFETTGYLDARIEDITTQAGLSHGSFYHYFNSKEEVFRELTEVQVALLTTPHSSSDESESSQSSQSSQSSEFERLLSGNRLFFERYRENVGIMAVIEEVSRYDDTVGAARTRISKHFNARAEQTVRRLQNAGKADPRLVPEIAATALGAMVARSAELWLVENWSDYEFDEIIEQLTLLWANAIDLQE